MKPNWQMTLLWGAVAMASAQAHAERVVLTFDVTPTQRYEGSYVSGAEQRTSIGAGPLAPFEIQYSFGTEHPWLDVPGNADVVLREVSVVPEPSAFVLAMFGLAGTMLVVRRTRRRG